MFGKIEFQTLIQLADFLKCFEGSTSKFISYEHPEKCGTWIVEFTGEY